MAKVVKSRLKTKPHFVVPLLAKGEGNLTLSLCDVPLLGKGEERFGEAKTG
jgi:hypothetical protein